MKKQAELALPPPAPPSAEDLADRARRQWQQTLLPLVRSAVDRITAKELAWLLNMKPAGLLDALAERERKGFRLEAFLVLLFVAPEPVRFELVAVINRLCGYKPPERLRKLDAEEELKVWRSAVRRLAPGIFDDIEAEVETT